MLFVPSMPEANDRGSLTHGARSYSRIWGKRRTGPGVSRGGCDRGGTPLPSTRGVRLSHSVKAGTPHAHIETPNSLTAFSNLCNMPPEAGGPPQGTTDHRFLLPPGGYQGEGPATQAGAAGEMLSAPQPWEGRLLASLGSPAPWDAAGCVLRAASKPACTAGARFLLEGNCALLGKRLARGPRLQFILSVCRAVALPGPRQGPAGRGAQPSLAQRADSCTQAGGAGGAQPLPVFGGIAAGFLCQYIPLGEEHLLTPLPQLPPGPGSLETGATVWRGGGPSVSPPPPIL